MTTIASCSNMNWPGAVVSLAVIGAVCFVAWLLFR